MLGDWADAPCVVLSCPGPLRRHGAALEPAGQVGLPQVLLGSESQMLAFAAAAGAAERVFFAPFPEMFADAASLGQALDRAGAQGGMDAVHLRFGSVRSARVLKWARNAAVLAERQGARLLTASHHPFASGLVLPASMQRAYRLVADAAEPTRSGGGALPVFDLPGGLAGADLPPRAPGLQGLEVACLDGFRSDVWAAGHIRDAQSCPADGTPTVLVPWNMDHPGSIVPELLARLAGLTAPGALPPRLLLLPFNYIGQTGIIRDAIASLREAGSGAMLRRMFLAHVRSQEGAAALRRLSRVAWVDGNDPEHWWTLARLSAIGVTALLIGGARDHAPRIEADEELRVEAETRCGALIFQARLPSLRRMPELLRVTAEHQALAPPDLDTTKAAGAARKPVRRRAKAAA